MIEEIADPALFSATATSDLPNEEPLHQPVMEVIAATLVELCLYVLVFYTTFTAVANRIFLRPSRMVSWGIRDEGVGMDFACKTVSAMFATICASLGVVILLNPQSRQPTSTLAANDTLLETIVQHFMLFATAYFLYDMYAMYEVYLAKQRVKSSIQSNAIPPGFCSFVLANPLISAHHLVIALVFAPMMTVLFRSHEPGMLMLGAAFVLESSTPFVTLRSVMADLGLKNTAAYVANGLTLIAVFFACRIAVYPIFFKVYADQRNISYLEALTRPPLSCYFYVLLTLLPQLYWFRLLVKGAFKTVSQYNNRPAADLNGTKNNNAEILKHD